MDNSIISIDLSMVNSRNELHQILKEKLGFPDFYGNNWNALWDAITGLVDMPKVLVFIGWRSFSKRLPVESGILRTMLKDYNKKMKKFPHLKCEIVYK